MYFAGREGLNLEICTGGAIDERQWIDAEVQGLCGISDEEMAAMLHPEGYERPDSPTAANRDSHPKKRAKPKTPKLAPTRWRAMLMHRNRAR